MRQIGLSPKLIADFVTSVVAFLLAAGVLKLDPIAAAALAKTLGSLAAFWAPPGAVTAPDVGPASDQLLPAAATRPPSTRS